MKETPMELIQAPADGPLLYRSLVYGLFLLALDGIISKGPFRGVILRFFSGKGNKDSEKPLLQGKDADRLCSQTAARVVGCVFLIMMFPNAFATLLDPEIRSDPLYARSPAAATCIYIASGYFLYDLFICACRFTENNVAFLIHAIFCCCAYAYPVISGHLYHVGCAFMMWELSTPLLYVRWIMLKSGNADSKWMNHVNWAFMAAFMACRVIFGPIMSWDFWTATQQDLAREDRGPEAIPKAVVYGYYAAMVILNGLNFYWFSTMVRMAITATKKKKSV